MTMTLRLNAAWGHVGSSWNMRFGERRFSVYAKVRSPNGEAWSRWNGGYWSMWLGQRISSRTERSI